MTENKDQAPGRGAVVEIDMKGKSLAEVIKAVEARYLGHVMTEAGGNKRRAADLAGLAPDTFRKKLATYDIKAVFCVG